MAAKLEIVIRMIRADGVLGLLINGKSYDYYLDAALIPGFVKLFEQAPGKGLAVLKKMAREVEKV